VLKAKFKLSFRVEAGFDLDKEARFDLSDDASIIMHPTKAMNLGTILYEIDEPNITKGRTEGKRRVEQFFTSLLYTNDFLDGLASVAFPEDPQLTNPEDFEETKTRSSEITADDFIVAGLNQIEVAGTVNLLRDIDRLDPDKRGIVDRSMRWFRRASETCGEDRFVCRWISYEALLGLPELMGLQGRKRSGTARAKLSNTFINDCLETNTVRAILEKHSGTILALADAGLEGYSGETFSADLKSVLKGSHKKAILQRVLLCVYEVRNSLFHKGQALGLIDNSSLLLRDIVRGCLRDYLAKQFSQES
jgi:hypothetical protein